jgi:nitroreductase
VANMSEFSSNPPAADDRPPGPAFLPRPRTLTIMDAIYSRRAVRRFAALPVPEAAIHALLYAAVQGPTLSQSQASIGFSVIRDRKALIALSDWTGRQYNAGEEEAVSAHINDANSPSLTFFHDGGTLIILYTLLADDRHLPECWMAAENLMLAACGMGLGTCLIGPAIDALNTSHWKTRLNVYPTARAVAAIVVGKPDGDLPPVKRFPPEVFSWIS